MRTPIDLTAKELLSVKIEESGEKLVKIPDYCPEILVHKKLHIDGSKPLVRKTVAEMLNNARLFLPKELTVIVRDAYRPPAVQKKIYENFFNMLKKHHPLWSSRRIGNEVNKFVADPNGPIPPGHTTGAAVDVSLAYVVNGKRLPMKSKNLKYGHQAKLLP